MDKKENTGIDNGGDRNSGDRNSGHRNSGDHNSGNRNSGNHNSGNRNSLDCNNGDHNGGDRNSGDRNNGDYNSGYSNSGNRNSGNNNSGYLNTNEPTVRIFNKDTGVYMDNISYPNWFYFNYMPVVLRYNGKTKLLEKEEGEKDLKYRWRKSFDTANIEDIGKTLDLPNFDYKIFEEISGISKKDFDKKLLIYKVEFNGKEFTNKNDLIEYIKNS